MPATTCSERTRRVGSHDAQQHGQMAENETSKPAPPATPIAIRIPWATIAKVTLALGLIWAWQQLIWVLLLAVTAVIIATGISPLVARVERLGLPRWAASTGVVVVIVGSLLAFLTFTGSSLMSQAQTLTTRFSEIEQQVVQQAPPALVDLLKRSEGSGTSWVISTLMSVGRGVLASAAAFVLGWILVVYFLIEAEPTYRWVRGFVPAPRRGRFDRTIAEAREVAIGFVVGNATTSTCAAIYFFIWLSVLGVPGALLLAMLAFVFDFIPVLGFYLSVLPAMAMAATVSPTLVVSMIPLYLSYDFIENYLIAPRIYGQRLRLTRVAVLMAFAVGAQLAGVVGALLALPVAAIYPVVERHWLREPFGDDVVQEHARIEAS